MSKAFGLAAARVGVAIAHEGIIKGLFSKVIAPYPVPKPVLDEAMKV
jgi:histidinol-phosphate/aromatic aminotransferase/cobyric acid decarboxylase-like protein